MNTRRAGLAALAAWALWPAAQAQVQVVEEVPFITTPDNVTLAMLQLAELRTTDHLIDLGSGDGRIVILAAKRFGATGLGVEIVPELVQRSRVFARAAGVEARVQFLEQDLFRTDLSAASVVTMYLLPEVNLQLRPALLALKPGTRIVSHDWDMGEWEPDRSITVAAPDKTIGREKSSRLHLWHVPAQVAGLWCSGGTALRVTQAFQTFSAELDESTRVDGRIVGAALHGSGGFAAAAGASPRPWARSRAGAARSSRVRAGAPAAERRVRSQACVSSRLPSMRSQVFSVSRLAWKL
jgi:SAM-dependent methyltransferase